MNRCRPGDVRCEDEEGPKRRDFTVESSEQAPRKTHRLGDHALAKLASHRIAVDSDETGLDKAYKDGSSLHLDGEGTLFVAGTKGNFWGNEWLENYKTMGVPLVAKTLLGVDAPYKIEDNERYKQLDEFMQQHRGVVKNLVGHSKGGAVVHTWMKNNPDFKGQSRLYATPYEDVLGKEAAKTSVDEFELTRKVFDDVKNPAEKYLLEGATRAFSSLFGLDEVKPVKGETRIANYGDPASILDRSAARFEHPDPLKYVSGGGPHDYHEGPARFTTGFGETAAVVQDKPGTSYDPHYSQLSTVGVNPMVLAAGGGTVGPDGTLSITQ